MDHHQAIDSFEWDDIKNRTNQLKHGVAFEQARHAFADPKRLIFADADHSRDEDRFFCLGVVGGCVMTVRFTYRDDRIRIFGAGYWTKGRRMYDDGTSSVH